MSNQNNKPRERAKERACDFSIKDTLRYRAVFKYPMSFYQLSTFLICKKGFDYEFFKKELKKLCKKNSVRIKDDTYYPPSIKPLSWEVRSKYSLEHLKQMQYVFKILESIPWVKLLAVTGAVAAFNADKKDDVDIFIICAKNRMWLTRFFVVLFLKAVNRYRTEKEPNGKICPNIYVDETNMEWEEEKRNIYTAHEIMMMRPVINRGDTYFKFMQKNKWAFSHFGNFKMNFWEKYKTQKRRQSRLVDLLEKIFMKVQLRYMKKHQTTEIATKNFIHFNKYDWSEKILDSYKKGVF